MNFNVVSAPDKRLTEEKYLEFKEDYLHSNLNWNELKNKYGLSKKEHAETCRRVKQEEGLEYRPMKKAKYYYKHGNNYYIVKRLNGKNVYLGRFPAPMFTENDLKQIVERCKKYGWDIEKCKRYVNQVKREKGG